MPAGPRPAPRLAVAAATQGTEAEAQAVQADLAVLAERRLLMPVQGMAPAELRDTFNEGRDAGARPHEALDIMAPRGTPVLAVDEGRLVKLFTSVPGGLTIYQFDPSGRYAYYYAHLDRYADGLREGMALQRGQLIGFVGSTGNANPDAPHLHFALFRLGPERQWWKGTAVNPYPLLAKAQRP
ncbi:M23 family metallopeptidase [uncultured Azohydromonas sp.]|uniref:M23 family metallopeptidase n=1 Tax=uncultured Azohydromonas sp. TaxID=487342 RepID=UPI00260A7016|nr:M23 family metallopeptidase [uncultured Azohydromonas sp.]